MLRQRLLGGGARARLLDLPVDELEAVRLCTRVGGGLALVGCVVPKAAARRHSALALVRLEDPWAERRLMMVAQRLDALPAHARRLVQSLNRLEA